MLICAAENLLRLKLKGVMSYSIDNTNRTVLLVSESFCMANMRYSEEVLFPLLTATHKFQFHTEEKLQL